MKKTRKNYIIIMIGYSFNIVGTDTIIEGQNSTLLCLFAANNRTVTGYTWKGKNNDSQD